MKGRKKEIIEVAIKRFSHFGISKTNMNEIAEDLKISKANLYYYYNDKITLVTDVIKRILEEVEEEGSQILERHSEKHIKQLLELYLDYRIDLKKKYHMLYKGEALDLGLNSNILMDPMKKAVEFQVNLIKEIFEAGIKNGELEIKELEDSAKLYFEIVDALDLKLSFGSLVACYPMEEDYEQIKSTQLKATNLIIEGIKSKNKTEI